MYLPPIFDRRSGLAVVIVFLSGLLLNTVTFAQEARLVDIAVTNTRDHLLLYFKMTDCYPEEMKKAIDNGIHTTFTFFMKLYEERNFWIDKKIADLKISHDIQYDSLKKLYVVRLSEKNNKATFVKSFDKAKDLMSGVMGFKLTELSNLHKGNRYYVQIMAELDKIKLPFYLHYIFIFLSLWDFETDWYTVDFTY